MAGKRVEIRQDDPSECGCDDQYSVVELDAAGRVARILGKKIKGYGVARNIKELAEQGRV
jgi:hypothetical protein